MLVRKFIIEYKQILPNDDIVNKNFFQVYRSNQE